MISLSKNGVGILCLVVAMLIQGCTFPSRLPEATSASMSPNKLIIVGKFQLDPPVNQDLEQTTHWNVIGDEVWLSKIFYATDNKPVNIDTGMKFSQWKKTLEATWDKNFFITSDAQQTHFNGGYIYLDMGAGDKVWFPGGFLFDPPAGAEAVYIGTIRFTRDDFWNIKNIAVIDDYQQASKEFSEKFGTQGIKLKKALVKPLRTK